MLKNIIPRHTEEHTEYHIEFTNEEGSGFSFNADKNGNIILTNDDQRANYQYAMEHPKEFTVQFNEFVKRKLQQRISIMSLRMIQQVQLTLKLIRLRKL